jgi:hypothetical protein
MNIRNKTTGITRAKTTNLKCFAIILNLKREIGKTETQTTSIIFNNIIKNYIANSNFFGFDSILF